MLAVQQIPATSKQDRYGSGHQIPMSQGTRYCAATQPVTPSVVLAVVRTFRQVIPSALTSSPITSTAVPSIRMASALASVLGRSRRLAPVPSVFPTRRRVGLVAGVGGVGVVVNGAGVVVSGVGLGSGVGIGVGVGVTRSGPGEGWAACAACPDDGRDGAGGACWALVPGRDRRSACAPSPSRHA